MLNLRVSSKKQAKDKSLLYRAVQALGRPILHYY